MNITTIDQADELSSIALDVVQEIRDELQDGELDRALAAMDEPEAEKRKIVPKHEFYGQDEPKYETGKPEYEQ